MGNCKDCPKFKVTDDIVNFVEQEKGKEGALITCLHYIQETNGYISKESQKYLSDTLKIPLSEIYGIITFYSRFTLEPKGKYNIQVCMGTACYVKGSEDILNEFKEKLNLKSSNLTEDKKFSLEPVRCIGACGLAPAIVINNEVYGKLSKEKVSEILDKYKDK